MSAAEVVQEIVAPTPVVSAFQTVPAAYLGNVDSIMNIDVLVAGDNLDAVATVSNLICDISNLRPLRVGALANSKLIESLTPLLLNVAILNGSSNQQSELCHGCQNALNNKVGKPFMKMPKDPSNFSFGATSSTVTSLGIIFGLLTSANPKAGVIGALLVIAVADNIADSLGIHIYRESTTTTKENTRMFTISNFITRFGITLTFVALFALLSITFAAVFCIAIGHGILVFLSYLIGVQRKTSTLREVAIHLGIAIPVIVISHFLGQLIFSVFG